MKDKDEDKKSPNSCTIVESGLDEIPSILGFNFQMPQPKDMESPNTCVIVAIGLDEIPSTSSVDAKMPHSLMVEMNLFHVIFNLNKVLITTHFNRGSHIVILHFGLKEFLEKCLAQF